MTRTPETEVPFSESLFPNGRQRVGAALEVEDPNVPLFQQLPAETVTHLSKSIEVGYRNSLEIYRPLIGTKGIPKPPSKEEVLNAVSAQLTPAQVDYMLRNMNQFYPRIKLVTPAEQSIGIILTLVNTQAQMGGRGPLYIWEKLENFLTNNEKAWPSAEWRWSFYQAGQMINRQNPWDNTELTEADKIKMFKKALPQGMHGTDRFDWAMCMANSLRSKPMDTPFYTTSFDVLENWYCSTALDEEGIFSATLEQYLPVGYFAVRHNFPALNGELLNSKIYNVCFRAGIDGPIKQK